jgi:hypothetical protein
MRGDQLTLADDGDAATLDPEERLNQSGQDLGGDSCHNQISRTK